MLSILTLTTLVASASATLNVSLCLEAPCENRIEMHIDAGSGCRTDYAGQALIFNSRPLDRENPPNQAVRVYRSTDCFANCGSGHLIGQVSNGGMMVAGYKQHSLMQSWEVVSLDEDGNYPPHGYCGIRHGDAQFFRGRTWRWQQIGISRAREPVFREIPIEEWDDALYPRETTTKYTRHGAVNSDGKTKWWQHSETAWSGVPLERWDDQVNILNDEIMSIMDAEGDLEAAKLRHEMEELEWLDRKKRAKAAKKAQRADDL